MTFRFRQFAVEDDRSTMKVGTDAMLLGSWADPANCRRILDIGTGCGILALMMAQKSEALITAIDIDADSVIQARGNFNRSPWAERMEAIHIPLREFTDSFPGEFDLIISNPPFFENSLKSPVAWRNRARHDLSLGTGDILTSVCRLLKPDGRFCLILPAGRFEGVVAAAGLLNLNLRKMLVIRSKPGTLAVRIALDLVLATCDGQGKEEIVIRNADNTYTKEYRELTREFHLGL